MPTFPPLRRLASIAATVICIGSAQASAQGSDLPGGFRLGSSLDEAKRQAAPQGWELVPLSPELPSSWHVNNQDIGVHVCGDKVASVSRTVPGNLDEFAQLVFDRQV